MSSNNTFDDNFARDYWITVAEECYRKDRIFFAWLASVAAGINDPFGEAEDVAKVSGGFVLHLAAGIRDAATIYTLKYDDPQSFFTLKYFSQTGSAQFNRAPPLGKYPGGLIAKEHLERWIEEKPAVKLVDLISRSIQENHGNVTLAMGSIAEILHDKRHLANKISSLNCNNQKDYYRFAGAYVGFQPRLAIIVAGYAGSKVNILGNPIAHLGWIFEAVRERWNGDKEKAKQYLQMSLARFEIDPIWDKLREFNIGFLAAKILVPIKPTPIPFNGQPIHYPIGIP